MHLASDHALQSSAHVTLLGSDFEVAVDDTKSRGKLDVPNQRRNIHLRDSKKDTSTTSQSTQKVTCDGQGTNASTTESSSCRDDTLEFLVHALFTMTGHDKSLILELLGNITRCGTRNFDPGLGEDSTSDNDECHIGDSVERVQKSFRKIERGRHVIGNTGDCVELGSTLTWFPCSDKLDQKVVGESRVEHLTDQEDVGREGGLQHDWHV